MDKHAANISTMYQELPFLQRFGAAAAHGFKAVEMQYAYAIPLEDCVAARKKAGA